MVTKEELTKLISGLPPSLRSRIRNCVKSGSWDADTICDGGVHGVGDKLKNVVKLSTAASRRHRSPSPASRRRQSPPVLPPSSLGVADNMSMSESVVEKLRNPQQVVEGRRNPQRRRARKPEDEMAYFRSRSGPLPDWSTESESDEGDVAIFEGPAPEVPHAKRLQDLANRFHSPAASTFRISRGG